VMIASNFAFMLPLQAAGGFTPENKQSGQGFTGRYTSGQRVWAEFLQKESYVSTSRGRTGRHPG